MKVRSTKRGPAAGGAVQKIVKTGADHSGREQQAALNVFLMEHEKKNLWDPLGTRHELQKNV